MFCVIPVRCGPRDAIYINNADRAIDVNSALPRIHVSCFPDRHGYVGRGKSQNIISRVTVSMSSVTFEIVPFFASHITRVESVFEAYSSLNR